MSSELQLSGYAIRSDVLRDGKRPLRFTELKPSHALAFFDALDLLYALERQGWQVGKSERNDVWWAWNPETDAWRRVAVVNTEVWADER